jgi:adenine/guanine phosphoribosyltransferase-like PRPP-binding protein
MFGEHGVAPRDGDEVPDRRPFTLKRGYDRLVAQRNVLVVDDVINTGFSIRGSI